MPGTLPAGLIVRPPSRDDLPTIVEMLVAREIATTGKARATKEDLERDQRRNWDLPDCDPEKDRWLVEDATGRAVGMAMIWHQPVEQMYCGVWVHPEFFDQGVTDYLLQLAIARAQELVAEEQPETQITISAHVSTRDQENEQALLRAGYVHVRSTWSMEITQEKFPEAIQWPEGLELRPFTLDVLYRVFAADKEAFSDYQGDPADGFERFQRWTKREDFDPSLWFIVWDGDEVAGFALCTKQPDRGYVSELGVRGSWRKQGLGLALLRHAFSEFYWRGLHSVFLHIDSEDLTSATHLYLRAGMHVASEQHQYQLEIRRDI